ncbi:MAG: HAD-IA family hydrolase [Anaerolineae bacterium]|nr:HAD-IA family hydrolase [Anaerolineae bacterium]
MKRYDLITFDMGYTLAYFYPSEEELFLLALRSVGLEIDPGAVRQARSAAWREYFASIEGTTFEATEERDRKAEAWIMAQTLAHCGVHDQDLVDVVCKASKAVFKAPGAVRLYDEVPHVLAALRTRGLRLGIVSNWSWDLHEYVHMLELTPYFDVIVGSARVGCEKPHPRIFGEALRAVGVPPERALHVGDSYEADVLGARAAGMDALWLDRAGAGGHPECRSIRDLSAVLDLA